MTTGRVIDQFGNPIEFAVVRDTAGNGTITDLYGNWSFAAVGDTIEADRIGFLPQVVQRQNSFMTIQLSEEVFSSGTVEIVGMKVKKRDLTIAFFVSLVVIAFIFWRMSK